MKTKVVWDCPHCSQKFTHVDVLLEHIKVKHPNAPRKNR